MLHMTNRGMIIGWAHAPSGPAPLKPATVLKVTEVVIAVDQPRLI